MFTRSTFHPPVVRIMSISIRRTSVRATGLAWFVTDSSTSFRHGSCGDLKNKKNVTVTGLPDANGTIHATRVDLEGAADN